MNDFWGQWEKKSRAWLGYAVSISLHIALIVWHSFAPPPAPLEFSNQQPIELTDARTLPPMPPSNYPREAKPTPPRSKSKQRPEIAESEDAKNRKLDPNAHILSDKTQTAEKQTRAKNIDDFREKVGTGTKGGKKEQMDKPLTGEAGEEKKAEGVNGVEVNDGILAAGQKGEAGKKTAGVKRDWKTLSLKDLGVGGDGGQSGASDDRLNGVAEGERTILSTREFRYFSYYHRIKELLRQYWKPTVERKLTKIWEKGKSVSDEEMTTRVLVLLTEDGKIAKISRVASSGFSELDEAAVEAFQRAGPFPNPPKGMIESDGFVRLNWDFILRAEAAPRIQFSSGGPGNRPLR